MSGHAPTADEIQSLLASVRADYERLRALADGGPADDLVAAVAEIGEHLLVTDEELRVQNEELTASARRLDLLVAAHDELFANAPVAYLQTDDDGLIGLVNHAARRLLRLPDERHRSRTLFGLVHLADRPRLRELISQARADAVAKVQRPHRYGPLEITLHRPDGSSLPVALTARRSDPRPGQRPVLHWELQPRGWFDAADQAPLPSGRVGQTGLLYRVAVAAAELEIATDPLELAAEHLRELVPGCEQAGALLLHPTIGGRAAAATGALARACHDLQRMLGEGPSHLPGPVTVADLGNDPRWPRLAAEAARVGVVSMLAVPLVGPDGRLGTLDCYSYAAGAFDAEAELIATAYAMHAGIAIGHHEQVAGLRAGLATRGEIGQAVGMLAERHGITADEAFQLLVRSSRQNQLKVRDIAGWVNDTSYDPVEPSDELPTDELPTLAG